MPRAQDAPASKDKGCPHGKTSSRKPSRSPRLMKDRTRCHHQPRHDSQAPEERKAEGAISGEDEKCPCTGGWQRKCLIRGRKFRPGARQQALRHRETPKTPASPKVPRVPSMAQAPAARSRKVRGRVREHAVAANDREHAARRRPGPDIRSRRGPWRARRTSRSGTRTALPPAIAPHFVLPKPSLFQPQPTWGKEDENDNNRHAARMQH
jgi:hypothetical protein